MIVGLVALTAAGAAAPGGPASALAEHTITIGDDFFSNERLQVVVDAAATWRNRGRLRHTITSDDGLFHSGDLERGREFRLQFPGPGVFRYFCVYHGASGGRGMSGVVVVGEAGEEPELEGRPDGARPRPEGPATLEVPQDFPSIQEAVDAARPNDLVLLSPKVYEEETVVISTPNLVLRGLDRNGVILDGALRRATGVLIAADGVTVENMTTRGYLANGFYWSRVDGFRGSYLTAVGNGDFGLYASGSRNGQLDHVFASGQPDAGIHIAGCGPCNILVTDSQAVGNGAGFSTTNTGGDLAVTNSEWARNFVGITLASLDSEPRGPQRATTVAGNWVHDNGNREAPAKPAQFPAFGVGILVAGGEANRVERNLAENNSAYGILVTGNIDGSFWSPLGNQISGNLIRGSGRADLALGGLSRGNNCFGGNQHVASLPPLVEVLYRCGTPLAHMGGGDLGVSAERLALFSKSLSGKFPHGDWKVATVSDAERPPGMPDPDPAKTPARPTAQAPAISLDTEGIALPNIPPSHSPTKEVVVLGVSPLPTPVSMLLGIYAYALPLALYVTWVSLAFWDLARRDELGGASRLGWGFFVLALPFIGPTGYLLFSRSTIPLNLRLFVVIGGLLIYGVLAGFAFLVTAT